MELFVCGSMKHNPLLPAFRIFAAAHELFGAPKVSYDVHTLLVYHLPQARNPTEGSGQRFAQVQGADGARVARPRGPAEPWLDALRHPQVNA